jgi:hypothetical protein
LSANVAPLRRLLVRQKRLEADVQAAARAEFYALGISRTSGRNGILVFLSTFERCTAVVPDERPHSLDRARTTTFPQVSRHPLECACHHQQQPAARSHS